MEKETMKRDKICRCDSLKLIRMIIPSFGEYKCQKCGLTWAGIITPELDKHRGKL